MSVPAPNFVLVSELQTLLRRDFPLASTDVANLNPLATNTLLDGEWLELESAASYALKRATAGVGATLEGSFPSWPIHTERGRYDTQAINKVNVLYLGMYEAESIIADTTGLAIGDALTVQTVTIGGQSKRALKKVVATTGGHFVVGHVTKTIGTLGVSGKVRFVHYGYQKLF